LTDPLYETGVVAKLPPGRSISRLRYIGLDPWRTSQSIIAPLLISNKKTAAGGLIYRLPRMLEGDALFINCVVRFSSATVVCGLKGEILKPIFTNTNISKRESYALFASEHSMVTVSYEGAEITIVKHDIYRDGANVWIQTTKLWTGGDDSSLPPNIQRYREAMEMVKKKASSSRTTSGSL
jgi:hypothetical protein